jgi:two-component system NtrC family sensor kinase
MRDFARPSTGERRSFGLSALLDKALQIFRLHEKSRRMSVDLAPADGNVAVEAVEDQIVQVLLNLLLNAADASGGTGALRISLAHTATEASVAIADQGCGMSAESQEHLFTPFFTTKEPGKGVGLGLFISEAIVRAHGGRITVQSTSGTGSTFTVCLPRSREKN